MSAYDEWVERERRYQCQALELTRGCHPAFNLTPTIELLRQADALGYRVVRDEPAAKLDSM